jgi:hypothetical protein
MAHVGRAHKCTSSTTRTHDSIDAGCYAGRMRASDLFETVIAVVAAGTVIGAITMTLYRVTRGNPETARLQDLKKQFAAKDDTTKTP